MLFFWTLSCLSTVATVTLAQAKTNGTENQCDSSTTYLDVVDKMIKKAKSCASEQSASSNKKSDIETMIGNAKCPQDEKGGSNVSNSMPMDCADVLQSGERKSGVYNVWSISRALGESPLLVYCDMETDGGGWTVFQRRGDYGKPKDYFNKKWASYKQGFGSIEEDFWLGNDAIHALSWQRKSSVRFDLKDKDGSKAFALYDNFEVEDEDEKYRLQISNYSGTAGDSMAMHNNMKFSTKDKDNDATPRRNCAKLYSSAWWFGNCFSSNLNGIYVPGTYTEKPGDRVVWDKFKGYWDSMLTTEIKMRPRDFKGKNAVAPSFEPPFSNGSSIGPSFKPPIENGSFIRPEMNRSTYLSDVFGYGGYFF